MATAPNLTVTLSSRQLIDPVNIRFGDLVEREAIRCDGSAVTLRGRVTHRAGRVFALEGHGTVFAESNFSGLVVKWYLLEREPSADEAERVRIADILDEQVAAGAESSGILGEDRYRRFVKVYEALDQHGTMVELEGIARWLRDGAVVPE
jgi:hypothetical protein